MSDPAFFGYGSLVNLSTHSYSDPKPAALRGWRRVWRKTHLRKAAYLSVESANDSVMHGLIAKVPMASWAALDAREAAYHRHDVTQLVRHNGPKAPTAIYQVKPEHVADGDHPILLSYLDVVVQGYLRVYGHQGVADFFHTTSGWNTPIINDRDDPQYARHQKLSGDERALVDMHLAAVMEQAE